MNGQHFRAILWLRWRLSRNQMNRGGALDNVLSNLFLLGLIMASLGGGFGGVLGGFLGLAPAAGWIHLLIWDVVIMVFLFFWGLSIFTEIRRSESIDFGRLMHLPVSPRHIFFINFVASHICPTFLIAFSIMIGLSLGLMGGCGSVMILLIPLVTGFFFMISAWTYCLRGWLTALLMNKRRRNMAMVLMVGAMMLLMQLPNIFFNVVDFNQSPAMVMTLDGPSPPTTGMDYLSPATLLNPTMLKTHQWVPLLWVPSGAYHLAEGRIGPAVYGALGAWLIGLLGLMRAYNSTIRFYLKTASSAQARPSQAKKNREGGALPFMEWSLPLISNQAAALALASFRTLFRAPEARIMLILPMFMTFLFGVIIFRKPSDDLSLFLEPLLPAVLTVSLLFGMIQISMNQFGFDRTGFRALMLIPVARWEVLLAKNLSLLGLGLALNIILLALLALVRGLPWDLILGGFFQFITGYLLLCILGNWASVLVPYGIAPGSMKSNKMPFKVSVLIFAFHTLFPIVLLPIFFPPVTHIVLRHFGHAEGVPVSLIISTVLLGIACCAYHVLLRRQGTLLRARETNVLATVTASLD